MADLIAQGSEPQHRWRHALPAGVVLLLGRQAGTWSVPWDEHVSRAHAEMRWSDGRLEVRRLPESRNPIYLRGKESAHFHVRPGDHFVIGGTTFLLADARAQATEDVPRPDEEKTFSPQFLRGIRFRNAEFRLDVLSRLPEVISGAATDAELYLRLVNMLVAGVPSALEVALVRGDANRSGELPVEVLYWDRRLSTETDFQPSMRLIRAALAGRESVLHVWQRDAGADDASYTVSELYDWAFCTPVPGRACEGWGIYVTGRFVSATSRESTPAGPLDLRDDIKFSELVTSTLGSLREVRFLERQRATLGQFFSPAVLDALDAEPDVALAPRETEATVMFCDLRGFAQKSEQAAGELLGLLERVSRALGLMTHHILEGQGVVGDFQGDAAMGFWGWPLAQPDAVARACRAALAIRAEFSNVAQHPKHPLADFRMGIGIATGRVVAGRIGTVDQVKVTVFGPVVNLASRLEGMTKILRAPILLDETTAELARVQLPSAEGRCRRLARVKPFGLDTPLTVTELLPSAADHPLLSDEHLRDYEQALDAYLAGRWGEAFELLHRIPAEDRAKDFLTIYIAQHDRAPPPNWQGVIELGSKG